MTARGVAPVSSRRSTATPGHSHNRIPIPIRIRTMANRNQSAWEMNAAATALGIVQSRVMPDGQWTADSRQRRAASWQLILSRFYLAWL